MTGDNPRREYQTKSGTVNMQVNRPDINTILKNAKSRYDEVCALVCGPQALMIDVEYMARDNDVIFA